MRDYVARRSLPLTIYPGSEITARVGSHDVHILALGIEQDVAPWQSPEWTVEEIARLGGIPVLAHPYKRGTGYLRVSARASSSMSRLPWRSTTRRSPISTASIRGRAGMESIATPPLPISSAATEVAGTGRWHRCALPQRRSGIDGLSRRSARSDSFGPNSRRPRRAIRKRPSAGLRDVRLRPPVDEASPGYEMGKRQ